MMPCNVYRSLALMLTVLIAGISAITAPVGAQTSTSTATATSGGAVAVVYHPPLRGAPAGRIGGASRGGAPGVALPALEVLAPDHVGLTAREQPTLVPANIVELTVEELVPPELPPEVAVARLLALARTLLEENRKLHAALREARRVRPGADVDDGPEAA